MRDPDDFDVFYAGTVRRVTSYLYTVTGSRAEAEDAAQEAYARAWQRWDKISGCGDPEGWVRTVGYRIAVNAWRRGVTRAAAHRRHGVPDDQPGLSPDYLAIVSALRKISPGQRRIGGLYGFGPPGSPVAPVSPRPVTSSAAPSPTSAPTIKPTSTPTGRPGDGSTSTASAPASQTAPASTASSGYSALAGQWKQTGGAGEALYIFPDGMIGFGEAGGAYYPLCAGELQPPVAGAYPFTAACGPATGGTVTLADGTLTIHIPGNAGGAGSAVTWVPVSGRGPAGYLPGSVPPSWLVGTWTISEGDNGDESFTVALSGAVTWSLVGQLGQTVSGAGTVQLVVGWGYRIATSFGSPSVSGVWPIFHLADGQLAVIGGMGVLDFQLTRAG